MLAEIRDITQVIFNLCGIIAFIFVIMTIFVNWKDDRKRQLTKIIEEVIEEKKKGDAIDDDDNVFRDYK